MKEARRVGRWKEPHLFGPSPKDACDGRIRPRGGCKINREPPPSSTSPSEAEAEVCNPCEDCTLFVS